MKRVSILILVLGLASAAWADTVSITGSTTINVGQTKTYTVSYSGSSGIISYDVNIRVNDITKGCLCCPVGINPPPPDNPIIQIIEPACTGYEFMGSADSGPIGNPWFTVGLTGVAAGQVTIYLEDIAIFDTAWQQINPTMGSIVVNVVNPCLYVGRVFNNGLTVSQSMVSIWNYLGQPNCWCCESQKYGNGEYTAASSARVDTVDMSCLKNSWLKNYNQSGYKPCCDFNLSGRVDTTDMSTAKNNWMQVRGTCGDVGIP